MLFIAGGTGFIGQYLLKSLAKNNFGAKCLARSDERASLCRKTGFEARIGDITDKESLKGSLDGIDTVAHLVGIIEDKGDMTFEKVHVEGTAHLVDEAKKAGVKHFFYQSALGASLESSARYQRTKAEAEEIVKQSGIPYTIFRPSLVIGGKDGFTEKLKELILLGPVVPVPGDGNAKFQPIYVEDWVRCFIKIFSDTSRIMPHASRTYEFGGPEQLSYNELLSRLMDAMGVKKTIVHLPISLAKAGLPFIGLTQAMGGLLGKKIPTVTAEQLDLLGRDNVCDTDSVETLFGFKPLNYKEALGKFIKK